MILFGDISKRAAVALSEKKRQKVAVPVFKLVLTLIWFAIILCCFLYRDNLSVEGILRYTPITSRNLQP